MKLFKRNTTRFTVFTIVVMAALAGLFGFTYMSLLPGPLSEQSETNMMSGGYHSHAEFEMGCGHCHAPIHCVSSDKCQECHMDVAEQRAHVTGLHGNLPETSRCTNCHVEHKGRDNDIRTLAYTNVNHYKLAGFSLEHHQVDYEDQPMDCQSCHSQDSTLTSDPDCITCHVAQDHDRTALHVKLVGSNCIGCHDGVDRMQDFVHDQFTRCRASMPRPNVPNATWNRSSPAPRASVLAATTSLISIMGSLARTALAAIMPSPGRLPISSSIPSSFNTPKTSRPSNARSATSRPPIPSTPAPNVTARTTRCTPSIKNTRWTKTRTAPTAIPPAPPKKPWTSWKN